jgi:hypothetical protein
MKFSRLHTNLTELDQLINHKLDTFQDIDGDLLEEGVFNAAAKKLYDSMPILKKLGKLGLALAAVALINQKNLGPDQFSAETKDKLAETVAYLQKNGIKMPSTRSDLEKIGKQLKPGGDVNFGDSEDEEPEAEVNRDLKDVNPNVQRVGKKVKVGDDEKEWAVDVKKIVNPRQKKFAIEITLADDDTSETTGFVDEYKSQEAVEKKWRQLNTLPEVLNYMQLHSMDAPNADALNWQMLIKKAKQTFKHMPQNEIDELNNKLDFELNVQSINSPEEYADRPDAPESDMIDGNNVAPEGGEAAPEAAPAETETAETQPEETQSPPQLPT